jgi:hypothetical protein
MCWPPCAGQVVDLKPLHDSPFWQIFVFKSGKNEFDHWQKLVLYWNCDCIGIVDLGCCVVLVLVRKASIVHLCHLFRVKHLLWQWIFSQYEALDLVWACNTYIFSHFAKDASDFLKIRHSFNYNIMFGKIVFWLKVLARTLPNYNYYANQLLIVIHLQDNCKSAKKGNIQKQAGPGG